MTSPISQTFFARCQVATEVSVGATTTCDTCAITTPTLAQLLRSWGEVPGPTGFRGSRNQQNPVRGSRRRVQPKPVRRELRHTQANLRVCCRPDNTEVRHCRTEDVSLLQSRTRCGMACLPRHQATFLRSGRRIPRDQRPCSMVQPSLQGQGHRTRRREGRKPGMSIFPESSESTPHASFNMSCVRRCISALSL